MSNASNRTTYFLGRMTEITAKDDGDPTIYIPLHIEKDQIEQLSGFVADPNFIVSVCVMAIPCDELRPKESSNDQG